MTVLDEAQAYLRKYIFLPTKESYLISSLWILHTWSIQYAKASPILYIHSPEPGSGKTAMLEVMETLVRNPVRATSITPSALFRVIEEYDPTILVDETDSIFSGRKNEDLRAVVNSGYRRGAYIFRMHRGEPRPFNTFGPKVLAGIYNLHLPDTVRDRSIPVVIRKLESNEHVEPFYEDDARIEADKIIDNIVIWVRQNNRKLEKRLKPISDLGARQWEIAEPLIAIGATFGLEAETRNAITYLFSTVEKTKSRDQNIFAAIKNAFGDDKKIFTEDLLHKLGAGWTAKKLAGQLAVAGIEPKLIRIGQHVKRGYDRADFAAALGELDDN